jgi:hypothetical protein
MMARDGIASENGNAAFIPFVEYANTVNLMSDLFFSAIKRLTPVLQQGDIESCEREVRNEIQKLPPTPFHVVLDLSITNDPVDAAAHFDRFFELESKRFQIGAAYTEMNGFDINPGRWYCDLLAYATDGGHDEYDWLSDWQSNRFANYQIRGLERLQQIYASDAFRDKENRSASYMSSLMVVVKFQRFMQQAATHMKLLHFPLYVTAHDFDFIASFDPRPESARPPIRKKSAEELVDELILKLSEEDPKVRFRAVLKLGSIGPEAKGAVALLIHRLDDHDPATRQLAATVLAKIDPESDLAVSALIARFDLEPLPAARNAIIRALGKSPTKKATDKLASCLFDKDAALRLIAVISLKMLGGVAKGAAPALQKLMEIETDEQIRSQATVALRRMQE